MSSNGLKEIWKSLNIYRSFFPAGGGGSYRRWIRLQHDIQVKRMNSDRPLMGPVTLFDFRDPNDAIDVKRTSPSSEHGWRYSDDEVIGGFSRATVALVESKDDLVRLETGASPQEESNLTVDNDFHPFIRWRGKLDTRVGGSMKNVRRSGFCALKSPNFPFSGASLAGKFNALELTIRTDGRLYWLNVAPDTSIPNDLFQAVVESPPPLLSSSASVSTTLDIPFQRVVIPFKRFTNTSKGRIRTIQRDIGTGINIYNIGLTLMDGHDGDFVFDLASIRAVNVLDGLVLGIDDEGAPY